MVVRGRAASGMATWLNLPACNETPTTGAAKQVGEDTRTMSDQDLADFQISYIGALLQDIDSLSGAAKAKSSKLAPNVAHRPDAWRAQTAVPLKLAHAAICFSQSQRLAIQSHAMQLL